MIEQQLKTLLTDIETAAAEIRDGWGNHSSVDLDDLTVRLCVKAAQYHQFAADRNITQRRW